MKLFSISVYIITKNEEQNLKQLLPLLADFGEVVIVDCGSTDGTEDVAGEFANTRFIHQNWQGYAKQKEFAKNQCQNEWVLNLDADETFDDTLLKDMQNVMREDRYAGMTCYHVQTLLGYKKPHALTRHNKKLRFFKKDKGHYPQKSVHESVALDGNIAKSSGKIYNWGTDIDLIIAKQNLYSSLAAQDKKAAGKKPSVLKLVFRSPVAFIKFYFFKLNFLNGLEGFITAKNYAYYSFQKEAKLFCLMRTETNRKKETAHNV